jgi:DNA-binding NarL/FixJ family response regulator
VSVASNGNQGLRLFREKGADLIITDIIMPDKEGLETIIDIKKEAPRVKIIAISGGGRITSQDLLLWAGKLGVNMTFSKPVDFDEFLKSIAILLAAD